MDKGVFKSFKVGKDLVYLSLLQFADSYNLRVGSQGVNVNSSGKLYLQVFPLFLNSLIVFWETNFG